MSQGPTHLGGAVDLAKLRTRDAECADFVRAAQADAERGAYDDLRDGDDLEEAYMMGHAAALGSFVAVTSGFQPPDEVLIVCGSWAWAALRGSLWAGALAAQHEPPDEECKVHPDVVVAYLAAEKAGAQMAAVLQRLAERVTAMLQRDADLPNLRSV